MAEAQQEEQKHNIGLRQTWRAGEKFPVHLSPSVEGMVTGTKWINEVLMVVFVVPSFAKKDGTIEKAALPPHLLEEIVLTQLAHAVSQRLTFTGPPSFASPPPQPIKPLPLPIQDISSSSRHKRSSSSSRSSSASSNLSDVGHRGGKVASGFYTCPFSSADNRHFTQPQKSIQSKSEERKYLRRALDDLYSEYSTLKWFTETVRSATLSSSSKPYASDLLWLQYRAEYLDTLLLHMTTGPWVTSNELIVDKLTRSFLELLVRVYPNRAYPDILDKSVGRWMKRKRVGICSQFGPVPAFLVDAKVTNSGIQLKLGWESWRSKELKKQDGQTSTAVVKSKGPPPILGEKK